MLFRTYKHGLYLGCAALLSLTFACGDDGTSEGDAGTSDGTQTGESGSGAEMGTGGAEGDGDGDPAGDGDGDPAGDGDGDPGDGDGDPGDGDGDPNSPCSMLEDQAMCDDDPACQSVVGQPLKENGPDAPCLEPSEFVGCIPMMGCGDAETWFCVGGNAKPVLVPDTCGPENGEPCDGPADPVDACP